MDVLLHIVSTVATISNIFMYSSNLLPFREVWRKRGWGDYSPNTALGILFGATCWFAYGLVSGLFPLILCNLLGLSVGFVGLAAFTKYAPSPIAGKQVFFRGLAVVSGCGALILAAKLGVFTSDPDSQSAMIGYFACSSTVTMFSAPLLAAVDMVKKRDASRLMLEVVIIGLINGLAWTVYGFLVADNMVIVPSGLASTIVFIQLVLRLVFPGNAPRVSDIDALQPAAQAVGIPMSHPPAAAVARFLESTRDDAPLTGGRSAEKGSVAAFMEAAVATAVMVGGSSFPVVVGSSLGNRGSFAMSAHQSLPTVDAVATLVPEDAAGTAAMLARSRTPGAGGDSRRTPTTTTGGSTLRHREVLDT
jgi:uncharacterized protein with PQ loop repeat